MQFHKATVYSWKIPLLFMLLEIMQICMIVIPFLIFQEIRYMEILAATGFWHLIGIEMF